MTGPRSGAEQPPEHNQDATDRPSGVGHLDRVAVFILTSHVPFALQFADQRLLQVSPRPLRRKLSFHLFVADRRCGNELGMDGSSRIDFDERTTVRTPCLGSRPLRNSGMMSEAAAKGPS